MANEAQPQAAEVTSAAPVETPPAQVTPDAATVKDGTQAVPTQASRHLDKKPAPFRARTVGDALARANAALAEQAKAAKVETPKTEANAQPGEAAKPAEASAEQAKPAEAAKTEPTKTAEAKPAEDPTAKAKEAEKQQRLSRGLAILAEREQKVLATEKRVKSLLAELDQRQNAATADPDVQLAKQLREAKAKGPGAVMQLLGIDLRAGVEEMAKTYDDPTPESIARKAAAEEFARLQRESDERQAREKREAEEKKAAQHQVVRAELADDVTREFLRAVDDFPFVAEHSVSAENVADWALQQEAATGKRPTAIDALTAIEKMLFERDEKARARQSAKAKAAEATQKAQEPAKPAPPPPKAEAKKEETKQEAKTAEKPRRKEAEVKPLVARIQRTVSAHERARLAMKNLGIS